MSSITTVRRLALAGVLLGLVVVVLGAYVRLTDAGLGCPDWPGCYGHITPLGAAENEAALAAFPDSSFDAGKAWREMIHRYAASTLGLIILVIAAFAIASRQVRAVNVWYALALLALVVFQGILGMLTVTWQLKPLIVTSHLFFGMTTVAMLWWLWLSLRDRPEARSSVRAGTRIDPTPSAPLRKARRWVVAGLAVLAVQVALGGWTSSNYAAVACPDFPTCQNEWWPEANFDDAFVLWHGLGINYEGGVLDHPARVAIHFTHRLGAIVSTLVLLLAVTFVLRQPLLAHARTRAVAVLGALALQLAIGIFMVLETFPLWLATGHNAGAALLMLATVALTQRLYDSVAPERVAIATVATGAAR